MPFGCNSSSDCPVFDDHASVRASGQVLCKAPLRGNGFDALLMVKSVLWVSGRRTTF